MTMSRRHGVKRVLMLCTVMRLAQLRLHRPRPHTRRTVNCGCRPGGGCLLATDLAMMLRLLVMMMLRPSLWQLWVPLPMAQALAAMMVAVVAACHPRHAMGAGRLQDAQALAAGGGSSRRDAGAALLGRCQCRRPCCR